MKPHFRLALLLAPLVLVACKKTEVVPATPAVVTAPVPAPAAAPAPAVPAAPADPARQTPEEKERAERQAKLDYATTENNYLTDARGQWAATALASSTFGDPKPEKDRIADLMLGAPDGKYWRSNGNDIGFDWAQVGYARPVNATEVRLAILGSQVGMINKLELEDTDGKWHTVWEGLSDLERDRRGDRTWFVKTFPKTEYKVKSVKYTIANNVARGWKEFDAAQLVGD